MLTPEIWTESFRGRGFTNILKYGILKYMRIWHEKLIPKLCQKHLCAMWREGLGCYKIITEGKKGYRNHPATKEFINAPWQLVKRLHLIRNEMIKRGYHPKKIIKLRSAYLESSIKPWQTLEQQIEILKGKGCKCKI
jgi:hypothetical protein